MEELESLDLSGATGPDQGQVKIGWNKQMQMEQILRLASTINFLLFFPLHRKLQRLSVEGKEDNPVIMSLLRPHLFRSGSNLGRANGQPAPPVTFAPLQSGNSIQDAVLELGDGTAYRGISFGADGISVAGECVFQTGQCFLVFELSVIVYMCVRYGRIH